MSFHSEACLAMLLSSPLNIWPIYSHWSSLMSTAICVWRFLLGTSSFESWPYHDLSKSTIVEDRWIEALTGYNCANVLPNIPNMSHRTFFFAFNLFPLSFAQKMHMPSAYGRWSSLLKIVHWSLVCVILLVCMTLSNSYTWRFWFSNSGFTPASYPIWLSILWYYIRFKMIHVNTFDGEEPCSFPIFNYAAIAFNGYDC